MCVIWAGAGVFGVADFTTEAMVVVCTHHAGRGTVIPIWFFVWAGFTFIFTIANWCVWWAIAVLCTPYCLTLIILTNMLCIALTVR